MTTEHEALTLADDLETSSRFPGNYRSCNNRGAARLRQQHALIVQMAEALKHARQVLNHHNLPLECNQINVAIASANTYLKGPKT